MQDDITHGIDVLRAAVRKSASIVSMRPKHDGPEVLAQGYPEGNGQEDCVPRWEHFGFRGKTWDNNLSVSYSSILRECCGVKEFPAVRLPVIKSKGEHMVPCLLSPQECRGIQSSAKEDDLPHGIASILCICTPTRQRGCVMAQATAVAVASGCPAIGWTM